jgi:hypothetical protein
MFDVYVIDSEALMVGRPNGILDAQTAERIVDFVEIKEEQLEAGFNRFCDLNRLDGINLSSEDLLQLAARRRAFNPNAVHVKSAFLAAHPLAVGVARTYELLLQSPRIEVRVFQDLESAAEWLSVKSDMLRL